MRVVCTAESLQPALALPRTAKRPAGRDRVGFAAHAFNMPEVAGTYTLLLYYCLLIPFYSITVF
jgi:hypothetical protein